MDERLLSSPNGHSPSRPHGWCESVADAQTEYSASGFGAVHAVTSGDELHGASVPDAVRRSLAKPVMSGRSVSIRRSFQLPTSLAPIMGKRCSDALV